MLVRFRSGIGRKGMVMDFNDTLLADAAAFMRSRVILTAAELDLFTRLHAYPCGAQELAGRLDVDVRALTRVLDCLITFGLLHKYENRYVPTESGMLLSRQHPETLLPMMLHLQAIWSNWSCLTDAVRSGANQQPHPVIQAADGPEPDALPAFIGAMHVVGRRMACELAGYCDLSAFSVLLDIGGGSGTYTVAFLRANPRLQAVLFDLPAVIPLAEQRFREEGLRDRVRLVAGDFHHDELPAGCDIALLSAIVHQNSPAENSALLRKICRALVPGGAVIIRDHIMDETRTRPARGALFALNMLVNTPAGDTYTFAEVRSMLTAAGFHTIRLMREGDDMDSLIEARRA
jgi:ubiquinone/menaquinone biosynthesis C-methylase UbiE